MAISPTKTREMCFSFITINDWIFGKTVLACPLCGCAYVRPRGIRTIDETQVVHDFVCDDGHDFRYRFTFYKGQMIVELHGGGEA